MAPIRRHLGLTLLVSALAAPALALPVAAAPTTELRILPVPADTVEPAPTGAPVTPTPTLPARPLPPTPTSVTATTTEPSPEPADCRLISFDTAKVVRKARTGAFQLTVRGEAPMAGVKVSLEPVIYIRQPEYWLIQVIGCMPEIGATVMTPYTVSMPLTGPMGTEGIEVMGSNKTQRIPLCNGFPWSCALTTRPTLD